MGARFSSSLSVIVSWWIYRFEADIPFECMSLNIYEVWVLIPGWESNEKLDIGCGKGGNPHYPAIAGWEIYDPFVSFNLLNFITH